MAMLTSDQLRRDWQRQRQRQRQKEERHQQRVNSKGKGKGKGKSSISISSDDEGSSSNSDDDNNSDESSGADVSASRAAPKPSRPPPAAAAPAPKGGVQVEVLIDNTRWRPSGTALPYSSHQHHPRRSLPLPSAGSEPRKNKIMRKSTGGGAIRKHAAAIVATVSESSDEDSDAMQLTMPEARAAAISESRARAVQVSGLRAPQAKVAAATSKASSSAGTARPSAGHDANTLASSSPASSSLANKSANAPAIAKRPLAKPPTSTPAEANQSASFRQEAAPDPHPPRAVNDGRPGQTTAREVASAINWVGGKGKGKGQGKGREADSSNVLGVSEGNSQERGGAVRSLHVPRMVPAPTVSIPPAPDPLVSSARPAPVQAPLTTTGGSTAKKRKLKEREPSVELEVAPTVSPAKKKQKRHSIAGGEASLSGPAAPAALKDNKGKKRMSDITGLSFGKTKGGEAGAPSPAGSKSGQQAQAEHGKQADAASTENGKGKGKSADKSKSKSKSKDGAWPADAKYRSLDELRDIPALQKPPYAYWVLVRAAILGSAAQSIAAGTARAGLTGCATIEDIKKAICIRYPYYLSHLADGSLQSSVKASVTSRAAIVYGPNGYSVDERISPMESHKAHVEGIKKKREKEAEEEARPLGVSMQAVASTSARPVTSATDLNQHAPGSAVQLAKFPITNPPPAPQPAKETVPPLLPRPAAIPSAASLKPVVRPAFRPNPMPVASHVIFATSLTHLPELPPTVPVPYKLPTLVRAAILGSPYRRLTQADICKDIEWKYPQIIPAGRNATWLPRLTTNVLREYYCFVNMQDPAARSRSYWTVDLGVDPRKTRPKVTAADQRALKARNMEDPNKFSLDAIDAELALLENYYAEREDRLIAKERFKSFLMGPQAVVPSAQTISNWGNQPLAPSRLGNLVQMPAQARQPEPGSSASVRSDVLGDCIRAAMGTPELEEAPTLARPSAMQGAAAGAGKVKGKGKASQRQYEPSPELPEVMASVQAPVRVVTQAPVMSASTSAASSTSGASGASGRPSEPGSLEFSDPTRPRFLSHSAGPSTPLERTASPAGKTSAASARAAPKTASSAKKRPPSQPRTTFYVCDHVGSKTGERCEARLLSVADRQQHLRYTHGVRTESLSAQQQLRDRADQAVRDKLLKLGEQKREAKRAKAAKAAQIAESAISSASKRKQSHVTHSLAGTPAAASQASVTPAGMGKKGKVRKPSVEL